MEFEKLKAIIADVLNLDENDIHINPKDEGLQNLSMNIYVVNRELLIHQIEDALNATKAAVKSRRNIN